MGLQLAGCNLAAAMAEPRVTRSVFFLSAKTRAVKMPWTADDAERHTHKATNLGAERTLGEGCQ